MHERLLTVKELAEHLSLAPSWIYSRTRTGEIPTVRAGKYCRFSLEEVMLWLRDRSDKEHC
jgi:excisionase family DNA binding protein